MPTYIKTIHTTMNQNDTVTAADAIAANLRAQGFSADVGQPYDDVSVKWYGMPAVDITVTEPDPPSEEVAPEPPPPDDTPEPMPVAEFGGTPSATVDSDEIGAAAPVSPPESAPEPSSEAPPPEVPAEPETAAVDEASAAAPPATEDNVFGNDAAIADTQPPEGYHFSESSTEVIAPNDKTETSA